MRLFKILIILLIITVACCESSIVQADECKVYNNLSTEQQYRVEYSYNYGRAFDYGYTLAAISLVESKAGMYKVNVKSQDYGLHQINIRTIKSILNVETYWEEQEVITKVITDDNLSAYLAMNVLTHFDKIHKGDWKKVVMSYNIGNQKDSISLMKGIAYYEKVRYYLNILKQCTTLK